MVENIILHACCAPCSTHCIEELRLNNLEPIIYFYNPNIDSEAEYNLRLSEIKNYCEKINVELIIGDYDATAWFEEIKGLEEEPEGGKRCDKCFEFRLKETLNLAKHKKMNFTTSLTVSRYKKSKVILSILKKLSEENNLDYLDFDFKKKEGYNKSIELSKKNNLYRQNYCGCVFSKRS